MEFGIRHEWYNVSNESKRPDWMRQKPLRPCKCDICFFWKEGLIDGIYHYARGKTRGERQPLVNPKRGRKYVFGCVNFLHLVNTAEAAIELKKLS